MTWALVFLETSLRGAVALLEAATALVVSAQMIFGLLSRRPSSGPKN